LIGGIREEERMRGLRPIDWILIIGIAGVTMALCLPAIYSTHCTGGRRAQCLNNERQLALALLAYANRLGVFPPSAIEGDAPGRGQSCILDVLPDLDEQDMYNSYNVSLPNWSTVPNGKGPSNAHISAAELAILRCPSNPDVDPTPSEQVQGLNGSSLPGGELFAKAHFAVNWGGGRHGWGADFEQTHGAYRGVVMTVGSRNARGEEGRCISLADIADGASNTILLGEKKDSQGWNIGGWAGSEFDVWLSPSYPLEDPWGRKVYTGSYHDGGVINVGFTDGSVRSLSSSLDRKLWYALCTRDGGEKISSDDLAP
jgi:prepilin-type processing-associated H-X9-DG protein